MQMALADPDRLDSLRSTDLLDSPAEAAFDRFTRLVTRALGVPVSLVSLVSDDRQFFKSATGLAEPWASRRETPLSHSFCQHVVAGDAPLVVDDAHHDPRVADNAAVDELAVTAYAGVPVHGPDGLPIGSLCAIDATPRVWSEQDVALLQDLADALSQLIAMRVAAARRRAAVLDVSHELRTALTALHIDAEDLQAHADAQSREQAGRLVDGLQRLSSVVTSSLAAMEGERLGHEDDVDVAAVLEQVAAVGRSQAGAAGREVVVEPPRGDCQVSALVGDLFAVLRDALQVLLQHGEGGVRLNAACESSLLRVQLSAESGSLPAEVAQSLTRRKDGTAGTEIDLSLAERVAQAVRGRLLVSSSGSPSLTILIPTR